MNILFNYVTKIKSYISLFFAFLIVWFASSFFCIGRNGEYGSYCYHFEYVRGDLALSPYFSFELFVVAAAIVVCSMFLEISSFISDYVKDNIKDMDISSDEANIFGYFFYKLLMIPVVMVILISV